MLISGLESKPIEGEISLDTEQQMERFLAGIERRAFGIAKIAVGNREDALDLVQDAMFKLVQNYATRRPDEWRCLFLTILQNRIRDWYRRNKIRSRWRVWLDKLGWDSEESSNALELMPDHEPGDPAKLVASNCGMEAINAALQDLPQRQQQVFLLRAWEGLTPAETAAAMGISEGSVKTHYFRAVNKLKVLLAELQHE